MGKRDLYENPLHHGFDSLLTFTEVGQEPHTDAVWQRLQGQLTESGDTLCTQASSLRSFQQLAESSRAVMKSSDRLMDASLHTVDEGMARMKEDKKDLDELKITLKAFRQSVETTLDKNIAYMEKIGSDVDNLFADGEKNRDRFVAGRAAAIATLEQDTADKGAMEEKLVSFNSDLPIPLTGLDRAAEKIRRSKGYEEAMVSGLKSVADAEARGHDDVKALRLEFIENKKKNEENLKALRRDFQNTMFTRLGAIEKQLDGVGGDTEKLWTEGKKSAEEMARLSGRVEENLADLSEHMDTSIQLMEGAGSTMDELYDRTVVLENSESTNRIKQFLSEDTDELSQFLSRPLQTRIHPIYAVENYGSAMAAFYTTWPFG